MKLHVYRIMVLACLVTCTRGQASLPKTFFLRHVQESKIDSLEDEMESKSQFQLQTGYANKVIFAGRNFGVDEWGATFGASYHHRSGVSVEYEGNYWSGMENKYALTELGAYYDKTISKHLDLTAGYWKLLYHNGDSEERKLFTNFSLLDGTWYSSLGHVNASYFFIKGNEIAHRLDINVSKPFHFYRLLHADKVTIEPTFTVTVATVNYISWLSSYTEDTNVSDSAFRIGNYEFTFPLTYKKLGKFEVNASWHQAWPVAIPGEEKPGPVSYFTLQVIRMLLRN